MRGMASDVRALALDKVKSVIILNVIVYVSYHKCLPIIIDLNRFKIESSYD